MITRRFCVVVLVAAVVTGGQVAGSPAGAKPNLPVERVVCGQPIDHSLRVANNLRDCPGDGLVVAAPNITIDLGGHRIDGTGGLAENGIENNAGHDGVRVKNGIITGFEMGVQLVNASGNVLSGLKLADNMTGISLVSSPNNTMRGNTASGGVGTGIALAASNGNILKGNTTSGNDGYGILLSSSDSNTAKANTASGNGVYGMALFSSDSNTFNRNIASGNGDGVVLSDSASNTFAGNNASRNDSRGFLISGDSPGSVLNENAAHENGLHGIESLTSDLTIKDNKANGNGFLCNACGADPANAEGLGIKVPPGTTNAKNTAKRNDDHNQCEASDVNCFVP